MDNPFLRHSLSFSLCLCLSLTLSQYCTYESLILSLFLSRSVLYTWATLLSLVLPHFLSLSVSLSLSRSTVHMGNHLPWQALPSVFAHFARCNPLVPYPPSHFWQTSLHSPRQTFSKVSFLLNLLCKMTVEQTFEKKEFMHLPTHHKM